MADFHTTQQAIHTYDFNYLNFNTQRSDLSLCAIFFLCVYAI